MSFEQQIPLPLPPTPKIVALDPVIGCSSNTSKSDCKDDEQSECPTDPQSKSKTVIELIGEEVSTTSDIHVANINVENEEVSDLLPDGACLSISATIQEPTHVVCIGNSPLSAVEANELPTHENNDPINKYEPSCSSAHSSCSCFSEANDDTSVCCTEDIASVGVAEPIEATEVDKSEEKWLKNLSGIAELETMSILYAKSILDPDLSNGKTIRKPTAYSTLQVVGLEKRVAISGTG